MNKRDQQIALINEATENLRQDRLVECKALILEAYVQASDVDELATVKETSDREPSDFHVLSNSEARKVEHFNDDSYWWDMYARELGHSVASAEKRYIFEELGKLAGNAGTIDASSPDLAGVLEGVEELRRKGFNPRAVVVPISIFMAAHKQLPIDIVTGSDLVLSDSTKLRIFWSSKVAPIDRCVVMDPEAGRWTVKLDPQTYKRLTIAIGRPKTPVGAVTFLAETVAKYEVVDRTGMYVIEVVGEEEID